MTNPITPNELINEVTETAKNANSSFKLLTAEQETQLLHDGTYNGKPVANETTFAAENGIFKQYIAQSSCHSCDITIDLPQSPKEISWGKIGTTVYYVRPSNQAHTDGVYSEIYRYIEGATSSDGFQANTGGFFLGDGTTELGYMYYDNDYQQWIVDLPDGGAGTVVGSAIPYVGVIGKTCGKYFIGEKNSNDPDAYYIGYHYIDEIPLYTNIDLYDKYVEDSFPEGITKPIFFLLSNKIIMIDVATGAVWHKANVEYDDWQYDGTSNILNSYSSGCFDSPCVVNNILIVHWQNNWYRSTNNGLTFSQFNRGIDDARANIMYDSITGVYIAVIYGKPDYYWTSTDCNNWFKQTNLNNYKVVFNGTPNGLVVAGSRIYSVYNGVPSYVVVEDPTKQTYLKELSLSKDEAQSKLIAGKGIEITNQNVISATNDIALTDIAVPGNNVSFEEVGYVYKTNVEAYPSYKTAQINDQLEAYGFRSSKYSLVGELPLRIDEADEPGHLGFILKIKANIPFTPTGDAFLAGWLDEDRSGSKDIMTIYTFDQLEGYWYYRSIHVDFANAGNACTFNYLDSVSEFDTELDMAIYSGWSTSEMQSDYPDGSPATIVYRKATDNEILDDEILKINIDNELYVQIYCTDDTWLDHYDSLSKRIAFGGDTRSVVDSLFCNGSIDLKETCFLYVDKYVKTADILDESGESGDGSGLVLPGDYAYLTYNSWYATKLVEDKRIAINSNFTVNINNTSVFLNVNDWNVFNKIIEVTVDGMTPTKLVWVSPDPANYEEYVSSRIICYSQTYNKLYFNCETIPENSLYVNVAFI